VLTLRLSRFSPFSHNHDFSRGERNAFDDVRARARRPDRYRGGVEGRAEWHASSATCACVGVGELHLLTHVPILHPTAASPRGYSSSSGGNPEGEGESPFPSSPTGVSACVQGGTGRERPGRGRFKGVDPSCVTSATRPDPASLWLTFTGNRASGGARLGGRHP